MMNQAEQKYKSNVNKQLEEAEKQESEALKKAKTKLGDQEATKLYDSIKSQELADKILKNKSLLYGSKIESHRKEVNELGVEGLKISKEYKEKRTKILENNDLSQQGKNNQIEALFKDYRARAETIIKQQQQKVNDYKRNTLKLAKETLEILENEASIEDFTEKDMLYISFILEKGNEEFLLNMLEEYDFNPFLLKMVNARDSKLPSRIVKEGHDPLGLNSSEINPNKLVIEHPLKSFERSTGFAVYGLSTKQGKKTIDDLIPTDYVASVDPWATSNM